MPYCTRCGQREYFCSKCGQLEECDCDSKTNTYYPTFNFNKKQHVCFNKNLGMLNNISSNNYEYCTMCGDLMPETEYCRDCGADITPQHKCSESNIKTYNFNSPHICPKRKLW